MVEAKPAADTGGQAAASEAKPADVKLGVVITDLCVFDFNGPDHAAQVLSLHPGVTFEQVQEATGFPLLRAEGMTTTAAPTEEQLAIIAKHDKPHSAASVCRITGVLWRKEKLSIIRPLNPAGDRQHRIKHPFNQPSPVDMNIRIQHHACLQWHRLAVRLHLLLRQTDRDAVYRLLNR